MFCIFGRNLVILAWMGDELSRGLTRWRTDGRTGATTIPEGQNWPRVTRTTYVGSLQIKATLLDICHRKLLSVQPNDLSLWTACPWTSTHMFNDYSIHTTARPWSISFCPGSVTYLLDLMSKKSKSFNFEDFGSYINGSRIISSLRLVMA